MRDHLGRFEKGSGNPNGRPPKKTKSLYQVEHRQELFEATEEVLSVNINGKLEKTTAMKLIYKQLVRRAVSGDVRCMLKTLDLRHQFAAEELDNRLKLLDKLLDAEQDYRENPEDVPNHTIKAIRDTREALKDWLH